MSTSDCVFGNPNLVTDILKFLPIENKNVIGRLRLTNKLLNDVICSSVVQRYLINRKRFLQKNPRRMNSCLFCGLKVHYGRARCRFVADHCHRGCRCDSKYVKLDKEIKIEGFYHILCASCFEKENTNCSRGLYYYCPLC